ncbi:MAG: serine/threonine protein phosphatase [Oscillospiraceae bacterium]|nr:serine/threonine protein phosphatase [Oscillospiraceae bacterium]
MPRHAQVIRPAIRPGRRVVAVSDIHGNLPVLRGILDKVCFTPDDVLILVGDLLEKGTRSLDTLRYVLELQKTHTVYALCGNCDYIDRMLLEGGDPGDDAFFIRMNARLGAPAERACVYEELWPTLNYWRERSTLIQMAMEAGLPLPKGPEELPALRAALLDRFPEETGFLLSLPTILEAGNFLFVHGGVPREDRLEELEAYPCMKNDDFLGQGHRFQKWVVVGHWPVTLYDSRIQRSTPLIDETRHIASIDGGCVLKVDGQLNALIIPDVYGEELDWTWYDELPEAVALDGQEASADPINIRWSDSVVEKLEEEGDCVRVRHPASGRELWLPRDFLSVWRDGLTHTEDATDYRLPVAPGDRLSLVRETGRGRLVKKDGVTGWYHGRVAYRGES